MGICRSSYLTTDAKIGGPFVPGGSISAALSKKLMSCGLLWHFNSIDWLLSILRCIYLYRILESYIDTRKPGLDRSGVSHSDLQPSGEFQGRPRASIFSFSRLPDILPLCEDTTTIFPLYESTYSHSGHARNLIQYIRIFCSVLEAVWPRARIINLTVGCRHRQAVRNADPPAPVFQQSIRPQAAPR